MGVQGELVPPGGSRAEPLRGTFCGVTAKEGQRPSLQRAWTNDHPGRENRNSRLHSPYPDFCPGASCLWEVPPAAFALSRFSAGCVLLARLCLARGALPHRPTGGAAPRPLPGNLSPGPRAHIRSLNRRFALSIFLRRFHYNIQRHFQIQLSRKHRKRQYSRYAHRARTRFRYRRVYLLCL